MKNESLFLITIWILMMVSFLGVILSALLYKLHIIGSLTINYTVFITIGLIGVALLLIYVTKELISES